LSFKELKFKPRLEAEVVYNLANLHETLREYPKALEYQKKALALRRSIGDKLMEGFLLNEIGEVYQQMNNQERALANFNAALEVYQHIDEKEGIADSHNNIGVLNYQQNNFKEAIANFVLALPAGLTSQNDRPVQKSYEYLSLVYKEQEDFKQALEYKELLISLNEFQKKEINEQMLLERQSMYVVGKNEDQILKLESIRKERERELAEQKRIQLFLYAFIGLGVIVVVLILYLYLLKRRSNQQLKTINAKVAAQNIELQNLNATKDKFFSIIGHDLKGPLNSLTSFSNLLINYFDSLSKEEIQSLAKDLDKSLKNLYSLLNNLLEWARSQTGAIDFATEQFDISVVLHENHELLNAQANNKQITILHENSVPLNVIAHKQSITTVVRNLISNSIKFTPEGGAIRLSAIQMNTEIIVSITDNGVGMSTEVIDKLFRFDAKHSTMGTANEKGTGLGLILCKDFVEKNGGRLWVTSEEGKGSVFYFTLPVAPVA
jgi:signal transduction histidine kinase